MTETFAKWLKNVQCEFEGTVDSFNLDVRTFFIHYSQISPLVSFDGENLERLQNQKLELPCFICDKSEVSEEELKEATPFVSDVVCLKKEANKYIFV